MSGSSAIHVVAGIIRDQQGRILLAKRPQHLHQGGLWEFPGGKCEADEQAFAALQRELHEELGITVDTARPFIRIPYKYPDKHILLDVWQVLEYEGVAFGREQQEVIWVQGSELTRFDFPAANRPILTALSLPDTCLITPEPQGNTEDFLSSLETSLTSGIRLVQFRAHTLDDNAYIALYQQVSELCQQHQARVLVNRSLECFARCAGAGLHMTSQQLQRVSQRPVAENILLAASCHNESDIEQANHLGIDFMLLSPVKPTQSHPETNPLGWQRFAELVSLAAMPVYALGGMSGEDLPDAQQAGAHGIAAISSLWCT